MTISLIGAHIRWDAPPLTPPQRTRFAAALGTWSQRPAASKDCHVALLAATGKPRGWSPQVTPDGSHVLFTGHIDNRDALAKELGIGRQSDEALYAAALGAWGDAADLKVIGQFATIMVRPGGRQVRLSRSPIAAPPLFFWHDRQRLIVTSLASAIFATGEVERRVDRQRIADWLFGNPSREKSVFEGLGGIPCGHSAVATTDGISATSYYDFGALPAIRLKDDREYVEKALELLGEGVRAALDGFSRPAISLSGGYDSQAVGALMARSRPGQRIEAYTSVPDPGWDEEAGPEDIPDERQHVKALAAMYPEIRPHWVDAAGLDLDHRQAAIFATESAPGPAVLGPWTHEIYRQAGATGCDVMVEAIAGNFTFSFGHHGIFATMARRGRWLRLWSEAGHLSRSEPRSRMRIISSDAILPWAPDWLFISLAKWFRPHRLPDPFESWCPLNRGYADRLGVKERARTAGLDLIHRMSTSSHRVRIPYLTGGGGTAQAFELLYGVARRDPTNYRPLVEFCLQIPDDQYLRQGQKRWLARRMLDGLVPDSVAQETRRGLRAADWHLRMGRRRHELIAEIDRFSKDADLAAMINFGGLRHALVDWPETTPGGGDDQRTKYAVLRGVAAARLIRFIEGSN